MPRLGVFCPVVVTGGVDNFLRGLLETLSTLTEAEEWNIVLFIPTTSTAGYPISWPDELANDRLSVVRINEGTLSRGVHYAVNKARYLKRTWTTPAFRKTSAVVRRFGVDVTGACLLPKQSWIRAACITEKIDVAYFGYPFQIDFPNPGVPVVCTPHDFNFTHFPWPDPDRQQLVVNQTLGWLSNSNRVVVSSEFIAEEARRLLPTVSSRLEVVRLGAPTPIKAPTPADIETTRKKLDLPERFVLTVARVEPHKNHVVIPPAFRILRNAGENIPIVLVGSNVNILGAKSIRSTTKAATFAKRVQNEIEAAGLVVGKDVYLRQWVSDHELDCLYRMATLLLMPTLYEAGSFPVREALRVGCPVAVSRIPSLVEEDSLLGGMMWMFDPNDPEDLAQILLEMLSNYDVTRERASLGAARVTEVFSWHTCGLGYLGAFETAYNRGSPS